MNISKTAVCFALGFSAMMQAQAQEQTPRQGHDNTLRVGVAHLDIRSKSDNLSTNGPAFLTPQPAGLTIGDATTLLLAYTRRLDPNYDLDVVLGFPPRHDVYGRGTLAPFGVVATVRQASPTVFINYNFGEEESKFRPFVGVGVNYTHFFDRDSTAAGSLASGGPTRIKLSDSWGLAAQAGARYKIDDRWAVYGSVATAKVKSDLTATTGSIERKTTIDFRPVVVTLTLGYSF